MDPTSDTSVSRIAANGEARGPLNGIQILDMTRIMAGPYGTQTLADLGADVIKVERPLTGDDTRYWGPPFLKDCSGKPTSESAYNIAVNRGKHSITVDISTPQGQDIILALAKQSDVLVENYRTGDLSKYGLGFEHVRAANPRIIYCSITGFGQTGPYKDRPGFDFAMQAMGGLMSVTGAAEGQPGAGPEKVGVAVADIMAGMYAVVAILSAVVSRNVTGRGQHIDVSLFESQIAFMANQNLAYLISGVAPTRMGNAHPSICPYQGLQTADDYIVLTIGTDTEFARFSKLIGNEEWAFDERFASNPARVTHRNVLIPMIADVFRGKTTSEWLRLLESGDVPCGPVNTVEDVFNDEHVRARGVRVDLDHPLSGTVPTVASPMNFSDTPIKYRDPPPLLGQHTDEVLSQILGYSEADIRHLREGRII